MNTTNHTTPIGEDAANGAVGEREAFEALMRMRGEDYLYRRDVPGCEKFGEYCRQNVQDQWEVWQARASANAQATVQAVAGDALARDTKQLADWLLTDPQTGKPLHFAGPLERDFLRMSRVKMQSKSGGVWTLTAGLKEGYLTAAERMANIERVAAEERQAAREPSIEQLNEMAYLLKLVPRGEVVCVQFLDVLRKQYLAAMQASGV